MSDPAAIHIKTDGGPWCEHNMPCPVHIKNRAVYDMNSGVFNPSWEAQSEGWMLVKPPRWLRWLFRRYQPEGLRR